MWVPPVPGGSDGQDAGILWKGPGQARGRALQWSQWTVAGILPRCEHVEAQGCSDVTWQLAIRQISLRLVHGNWRQCRELNDIIRFDPLSPPWGQLYRREDLVSSARETNHQGRRDRQKLSSQKWFDLDSNQWALKKMLFRKMRKFERGPCIRRH